MEIGPRKDCVRTPKFVLTEKLLWWVRPLAGPCPQPRAPVSGLREALRSLQARLEQPWVCLLCPGILVPLLTALLWGPGRRDAGHSEAGSPYPPGCETALRQQLPLLSLQYGRSCAARKKIPDGMGEVRLVSCSSWKNGRVGVGLWGSRGLLSQFQAGRPWVHCFTPLGSLCGTEENRVLSMNGTRARFLVVMSCWSYARCHHGGGGLP